MKKLFDFRSLKKTQLWPLFFNESFRGVAVTLITTFSTIFIYQLLSSLTGNSQKAILLTLLYFINLYIFKFISNLWAEELAQRIGLKNQICLGELLLVFSIGAMFFSLEKPWLLILASTFMGCSTGFYWFGRHGLMAKLGQRENYGKEIGTVGVIQILPLLGAPLIGGMIINWLGYQSLFLVAILFVILSLLILSKLKELVTHQDTNLKEILVLFRTRKKMFLTYLGNSGAGTIYAVIFPLYLFLILKKEIYLGQFFSFSMILVALVNFAVGSWVDFRGKKGPLVLGSLVSSFVWWGRFLSGNPASLLILDIIDRLTGGMTGIPLSVLSYEKAIDGQSTGRAILFRELAISLGSILTCLLILGVILSGLDLKFAFLIAAFFSLFPLLIVRKDGF